jgi:hypothetical protein
MAGICNTYVRNNETEKYVKRVKNAGKILDPFSVVDIDNFIGGCKDLDIWNSMVCWPLRSTQNTGTNSALSLGGLFSSEMTIANGSTWNPNGIVLSDNSYAIGPTYNVINGGFAIFARKQSVNFGQQHLRAIGDYLTNGLRVFWSDQNGNTRISAAQQGGVYDHVVVSLEEKTIEFIYTNVGGENGTKTSRIDQNTYSSTDTIVSYNTNIYGFTQASTIWRGNIHIYVHFDVLPSERINAFYDLYKTTLGKGLGLP